MLAKLSNVLVNPFTGMVLNTEVPNPRGCNQHTGPNCGHRARKIRSLADSYKALQGAAIHPATGFRIPINYMDYDPNEVEFSLDEDRKLWGLYLPDDFGRDIIQVGKSPRQREIAAHEVGHLASGHSEFPESETREDHLKIEEEAWAWALKNRRKLGISRKKLLQTKRIAKINEARSGKINEALEKRYLELGDFAQALEQAKKDVRAETK